MATAAAGWVLVAGYGLRLLAQPPEATGSDAGQGAGSEVTTLKTTARLVVLDVVVSDAHGRPLRGLTAADICLFEDGVSQTLLSVTEHDGAVRPVPAIGSAPELPPNTFAVHAPELGNGAMTAVVLGKILWQDAPRVRDELKAYLKATAPETPIAIFAMDYQGMHLVQDFSSDQKLLQEAAASKRILPPLGLAPVGDVVSHGTLQLSRYLNKIPGRINVIWFTSGAGETPAVGQGPSDSSFSDLSSFVQSLNGPRNVLRLSRVAVYALDAAGLTCFDDGGANPCLADIDMAGEMFKIADSPPGRMAEMAEATGGKAVYHTNGLQHAIADIVTTGSHYYTISYTPTNGHWNGAFRRIAVKLNTSDTSHSVDWGTNGVRAQYRHGYYARSVPAEDGAPPATFASAEDAKQTQRRLISVSPKGSPGLGHGSQEDPLRRAMAFASVTPTTLKFTITATPSDEMDHAKRTDALPKNNFLTPEWRNTPYRNYRVHYTIAPQDLRLTPDGDGYREMYRFVIVIYRDNGEPVNSIATTVPVNVKQADYESIQRTGLTFEQVVAIPQKINTNATPVTANFFLRAGVAEVETGRIGAVEVPVEWIKIVPESNLKSAFRCALP